jgi:flagellar assembly protein FliH
LSKNFLRAGTAADLGHFETLLQDIPPEPIEALHKRHLGRTAEGLLKLKEEAKQEGYGEGLQEGYEVGLVEGRQEALNEMRQSVQDFREALDRAVGRVEDAMGAWYAAAEESLGSLAAVVAARILARELATEKDAITDLAREALSEVAAADKVRIRVHPFDAAILREHQELVLAGHPTVRGVEIVDDPSLSGGTLVESDAGTVDACIRTQLELAFQALQGRAA